MAGIDEWDKMSEKRKESILDLVRSFNLGAEPMYIGVRLFKDFGD